MALAGIGFRSADLRYRGWRFALLARSTALAAASPSRPSRRIAPGDQAFQEGLHLTMFSSKQINTDPTPWEEWETDTRYSQDEVDAAIARGRCWRGLGLHPRPEFDNSPNPILVDFRGACGGVDRDGDR